MNPKEHSLAEKRDNKGQQQQPKNAAEAPQLSEAGTLVRESAYAAAGETESGMSHSRAPPTGSASGMPSGTGGGQAVDQRGYPVSAHNSAQGVGFDGRSAGAAGDGTNGIPTEGGWVHGAGGLDPRSGGGGSIALLEHSRPPQQQQQQGGPQHPGSLAPGLMYASTAARQAANMDPSL